MIKIDIGVPEACFECPVYDIRHNFCRLDIKISCNYDERPRSCPIIECDEAKEKEVEDGELH